MEKITLKDFADAFAVIEESTIRVAEIHLSDLYEDGIKEIKSCYSENIDKEVVTLWGATVYKSEAVPNGTIRVISESKEGKFYDHKTFLYKEPEGSTLRVEDAFKMVTDHFKEIKKMGEDGIRGLKHWRASLEDRIEKAKKNGKESLCVLLEDALKKLKEVENGEEEKK